MARSRVSASSAPSLSRAPIPERWDESLSDWIRAQSHPKKNAPRSGQGPEGEASSKGNQL
jgi:hypothetical protein